VVDPRAMRCHNDEKHESFVMLAANAEYRQFQSSKECMLFWPCACLAENVSDNSIGLLKAHKIRSRVQRP
jgi:hypothetical protein